MGEVEWTVVERAAAGDERAFARIVEDHKDMVYTLCCRTLSNAHDAEEVFQDTFVSAFRNISSFRGDSKLSTWLYRIALNRCRDFMASRSARNTRATASLDNDTSGFRDSAAAPPKSDAAETLEEAMASIPEDYRTAINLHCLMGYSYDEAGDVMGIPGGTVKTYVHRGKAALRNVLGGRE